MASKSPTFEIVGDGDELSDAAISALAALLLGAADRSRPNDTPPPQTDLTDSQPLVQRRRPGIAQTEAQSAAK